MLITLEGIEGAGKTSQIQNIVALLEARGYECVTTREPGGTEIGLQIREVLLNPANIELDARAELMLYVADRIQHIQRVIRPQLKAGKVVLCDRFFDATLVYQGYARGLDKRLICDLHRLVCDDLKPDLTLLFDLKPETGLSRAWRQINSGGRVGAESRFEQEKIDFHQKVRNGYLDVARSEPQRFRLVDAEQNQSQVFTAISLLLNDFLDGR